MKYIILLFFFVCASSVANSDANAELREIVKILNKRGSYMLNDEVMFERVWASNMKMNYNLKLLVDIEQEPNYEDIKAAMIKKIKTDTCNLPGMVKSILSKGIDLKYWYYGPDGKLVFSFSLVYGDCL